MEDGSLPDGFVESGPLVPFEALHASGAVRWIGPQVDSMLGIVREDIDPQAFWETVIVPDDQRTVTASRARTVEGSYSVDYRVEHGAGDRVVWVNEVGRVLRDPDGTLVIRGYLIDVTDRKRQEVALWKSEERFRSLLRHAPDAIVLTGPDGIILNLNDQAEVLFGYSLADVAGSSIEHLVPAPQRRRLTELHEAFERDPHRRTLIDAHGFDVENRFGATTHLALSMSRVTAADGSSHLIHSFRDLSSQARAASQQAVRRVRRVANALPALVASVGIDHVHRFVNEAYARWLGRERDQVEGHPVRDVMGDRVYNALRAPIQDALGGSAAHFRCDLVGPTGEPFPADVSVVPQFDDGGAVHGYYMVIFDVSREVAESEADRRQRAELAHVGRMATLDELAASLAHELNQPLSAVVANAQAADRLLARTPPDVGEARAALSDIAADGQRAGGVISSMRELLERGYRERSVVDIREVADDVLSLVNSEAIRRRVRLTVHADRAAVPDIMGDAPQLKQVLLNLVMNAIEASASTRSRGGSVRIEIERDEELVTASVSDDGPGFGNDDPEDLFAPFMSRRPGGLGMGLAISRTIAEAHGGSLTGSEGLDGGARFTLTLPRTQARPERADDA